MQKKNVQVDKKKLFKDEIRVNLLASFLTYL